MFNQEVFAGRGSTPVIGFDAVYGLAANYDKIINAAL